MTAILSKGSFTVKRINSSFNYIRYSNDGKTFTAASAAAIQEAADTPAEGRNLLLNSKVTKSGTSYNIGYWTASRDFIAGETLVVTIQGNIPGNKLFGLWLDSGSLLGAPLLKVDSGLYSTTIKVPSGVKTRIIGIYLISNQTAGDSWSFEWIKLEPSNIRTAWTPAPEDLVAGTTTGNYLGTLVWEKPYASWLFKDYQWTLIKGDKGDKGDTGAQGIQGLQGIQGNKGEQGVAGPSGQTPYFHIKYSDYSDGTSMNETGGKYIGTYVDFTSSDSTDKTKYTWVLVKGAQGDKGDKGIAGTNGTNGQTSYLHIAYANSANGATGFDVSNGVGKLYIGQYTDFIAADSTDYTKYTWTLIKGEKGDTGAQGIQGLQGIQGEKGNQGVAGPSGQTPYFHIKYSDYSDGTSMNETGGKYIGTYVDFTSADSTDKTKYTWVLVKGAQGDKGDRGIAGTNGTNGQTSYLHIAYANSANGSSGFDVSNGSGKLYIGQYTDFTAADSTDYTKYTWTLIKGDKGDTGAQGIQGLQGIQGNKGEQGVAGPSGQTPYFHIKYSDYADGTSMNETGGKYIGTYVDFTSSDSTDKTKYTWVLVKGAQGDKGDRGIAGTNGTNGQTSYLHIAYANSANGSSGFDISSGAGKLYIGQYTDFTAADSTDCTKYTWTLIKGDKGDTGAQGIQGLQGIQGEKGNQGVAGPSGQTSYFHIKYSDYADGTSMNETGGKYIGTYVDFTSADSTDKTKYTWVLVKGAQGDKGDRGIAGTNGTNGQTSYLHIAYANSANGSSGFDVSNGSGKLYIGQYTDFTAADSTDYTKYTWTLIKGDKGDTGAKGDKGDTGAKGDKGEELTAGKMMFADPEFRQGMNGVSIYNNYGNSNVNVNRVTRGTDCPTTSGFELEIKTTGSATPGLGGCVQNIQSRPNAVFIQRIIAKIPVGYSINTASNSMGSGYTDSFLTSNVGTGKYETYIRKVVCGASGTFSSGGHLYLIGPATYPVTWRVASLTVYDLTAADVYDNLATLEPSSIVLTADESNKINGKTNGSLGITTSITVKNGGTIIGNGYTVGTPSWINCSGTISGNTITINHIDTETLTAVDENGTNITRYKETGSVTLTVTPLGGTPQTVIFNFYLNQEGYSIHKAKGDFEASYKLKTFFNPTTGTFVSFKSSIEQTANSISEKVKTVEDGTTSAQIAAKVKSETQTEVTVDLTGLNQNLYYPITFSLSPGVKITLMISRTLDATQGVPGYSTHSRGFSLILAWETNASCWGTYDVKRKMLTMQQLWVTGGTNVASAPDQIIEGSIEYIYLRGGSKYVINANQKDVPITLHQTAVTYTYGSTSHTLSLLTSVIAAEADWDKLLDTGIDIENKKINLTADNVEVKNNSGIRTALIDSTGKLTTNLVHADEIVSKGIQARTIDAEGATFRHVSVDGYLRSGVEDCIYPRSATETDRYFVNDKLNIMVRLDNTSGSVVRRIYLPNDPEFIGARVMIISNPFYDDVGDIATNNLPYVEIRTGRNFMKHTYMEGGGGSSADRFCISSDTTETDNSYQNVVLSIQGNVLQCVSGFLGKIAAGYAANKIVLKNGYIELLGVPSFVKKPVFPYQCTMNDGSDANPIFNYRHKMNGIDYIFDTSQKDSIYLMSTEEQAIYGIEDTGRSWYDENGNPKQYATNILKAPLCLWTILGANSTYSIQYLHE